ncbi:MAG: addiction module toxin RelE [Bradymonadales bacterium]|nr:MAG: addiction module toxin RelE [Bradymonadales bacterium]
MPRTRRDSRPDGIYHVMNRGIDRAPIAQEEWAFALFKRCLEEISEKFNGIILAFCLMRNHYHLLLKTPEQNLSRIMKHFGFVYTQRFNRRYGRDGPLFRGRFHSILVAEEPYLLQVVRYIHLNPVKASVVKSPESYRWSSHPLYLDNVDEPKWLDKEYILRYFGIDSKEAPRHFQGFVEEGCPLEVNAFYERVRLARRIDDDVVWRAYFSSVQKKQVV